MGGEKTEGKGGEGGQEKEQMTRTERASNLNRGGVLEKMIQRSLEKGEGNNISGKLLVLGNLQQMGGAGTQGSVKAVGRQKDTATDAYCDFRG